MTNSTPSSPPESSTSPHHHQKPTVSDPSETSPSSPQHQKQQSTHVSDDDNDVVSTQETVATTFTQVTRVSPHGSTTTTTTTDERKEITSENENNNNSPAANTTTPGEQDAMQISSTTADASSDSPLPATASIPSDATNTSSFAAITNTIPSPSEWPRTSARNRTSLILPESTSKAIEERRRRPFMRHSDDLDQSAAVSNQESATIPVGNEDQQSSGSSNNEQDVSSPHSSTSSKPHLVQVDENVEMRIPQMDEPQQGRSEPDVSPQNSTDQTESTDAVMHSDEPSEPPSLPSPATETPQVDERDESPDDASSLSETEPEEVKQRNIQQTVETGGEASRMDIQSSDLVVDIRGQDVVSDDEMQDEESGNKHQPEKDDDNFPPDRIDDYFKHHPDDSVQNTVQDVQVENRNNEEQSASNPITEPATDEKDTDIAMDDVPSEQQHEEKMEDDLNRETSSPNERISIGSSSSEDSSNERNSVAENMDYEDLITDAAVSHPVEQVRNEPTSPEPSASLSESVQEVSPTTTTSIVANSPPRMFDVATPKVQNISDDNEKLNGEESMAMSNTIDVSDESAAVPSSNTPQQTSLEEPTSATHINQNSSVDSSAPSPVQAEADDSDDSVEVVQDTTATVIKPTLAPSPVQPELPSSSAHGSSDTDASPSKSTENVEYPSSNQSNLGATPQPPVSDEEIAKSALDVLSQSIDIAPPQSPEVNDTSAAYSSPPQRRTSHMTDYDSPQFSTETNPFAAEAGEMELAITSPKENTPTEEEAEKEEQDLMDMDDEKIQEGSEQTTQMVTEILTDSDESDHQVSSEDGSEMEDEDEHASSGQSPTQQRMHFTFNSVPAKRSDESMSTGTYSSDTEEEQEGETDYTSSEEDESESASSEEQRPQQNQLTRPGPASMTSGAQQLHVPPRKRFQRAAVVDMRDDESSEKSSIYSSSDNLSDDIEELMNLQRKREQEAAARVSGRPLGEPWSDSNEDNLSVGESIDDDLLREDLFDTPSQHDTTQSAPLSTHSRPSLPVQHGRRPISQTFTEPVAQKAPAATASEPVDLISSSDEEEETAPAPLPTAAQHQPSTTSSAALISQSASNFKDRYPDDVRSLRQRFVPRTTVASQRIYNRGKVEVDESRFESSSDILSSIGASKTVTPAAQKPSSVAASVDSTAAQQASVLSDRLSMSNAAASPVPQFETQSLSFPRQTPIRKRDNDQLASFLQNETISTPRTVMKSTPLLGSTPNHFSTPKFQPLSSRKRKPNFFDKLSQKLKQKDGSTTKPKSSDRFNWRAAPEKPFASPQSTIKRSNPFSRFSSRRNSNPLSLTPRTSIGTPLPTPRRLTPSSNKRVGSGLLGKRAQMDTPTISHRPVKRTRHNASTSGEYSEASMQRGVFNLDIAATPRNSFQRNSLLGDTPILDSSLLLSPAQRRASRVSNSSSANLTPRFASPTIRGNRRYLGRS